MLDPIEVFTEQYHDNQVSLEHVNDRRAQWVKDETLLQVTRDEKDPEKIADAMVDMVMSERDLLAGKVLNSSPRELMREFSQQLRAYLIERSKWTVIKAADGRNFDE